MTRGLPLPYTMGITLINQLTISKHSTSEFSHTPSSHAEPASTARNPKKDTVIVRLTHHKNLIPYLIHQQILLLPYKPPQTIITQHYRPHKVSYIPLPSSRSSRDSRIYLQVTPACLSPSLRAYNIPFRAVGPGGKQEEGGVVWVCVSVRWRLGTRILYFVGEGDGE